VTPPTGLAAALAETQWRNVATMPARMANAAEVCNRLVIAAQYPIEIVVDLSEIETAEVLFAGQ